MYDSFCFVLLLFTYILIFFVIFFWWNGLDLLYCLNWSNVVVWFFIYVMFDTFSYSIIVLFMIIVCINMWLWVIFTFSKQFLGDIQVCMIVFSSLFFILHTCLNLLCCLIWQDMDWTYFIVVAQIFIYVMFVSLFFWLYFVLYCFMCIWLTIFFHRNDKKVIKHASIFSVVASLKLENHMKIKIKLK